MSLFVDTSVWSLSMRRDAPVDVLEVAELERALNGGDTVVATGLVLQELLQGFGGPRSRDRIVGLFSMLPMIVPAVEDHVEAASLRNRCRRRGLQVGTIDALIAQLCIRHRLTLLTTDRDFDRIAEESPLNLWRR
jgi:predicted nucleic acid-binding protein